MSKINTNKENAKFTLKILWLDCNLACSIEHVINEDRSPLTPYFFWPRNDAWSQIKSELESKPWISNNEKIYILNKAKQIINYWQENNQKKSVEQAQEEFPDLFFVGSSN